MIQAEAPPHGGRGPSVLLVEDEPSISDPFASALARGGFRPSVAITGAQALLLLRELSPDVVLLDLALPDADGRDVCRQIRAESDVPIIIITASGSVTDRVVGLELGADDYVVKPFAVGEVIARIRAVLRRGRASTASARQIDVGELRIEPAARRVVQGRSRARADPQGVRPPGSARRRCRTRRHARVADVRRLGRELVRIDQDA